MIYDFCLSLSCVFGMAKTADSYKYRERERGALFGRFLLRPRKEEEERKKKPHLRSLSGVRRRET